MWRGRRPSCPRHNPSAATAVFEAEEQAKLQAYDGVIYDVRGSWEMRSTTLAGGREMTSVSPPTLALTPTLTPTSPLNTPERDGTLNFRIQLR